MASSFLLHKKPQFEMDISYFGEKFSRIDSPLNQLCVQCQSLSNQVLLWKLGNKYPEVQQQFSMDLCFWIHYICLMWKILCMYIVPILRAILLVSACAKFRFIGFWPIPSSSSMYFRKGFRSKADTVSKTKPAL